MLYTVSLKDNRSFRRLYSSGKSAVSPYMAIYVKKNRLGTNRLGMTVSKKIGCAVVRNRTRRRLKEIYRMRRRFAPATILSSSRAAAPSGRISLYLPKTFSAARGSWGS